MDCSWPGTSVHGDSPGKNTGVGCLVLLQGIFPTPGIKPRSPAVQGDSLPAELPLPFMTFLKINEYWYVPDGPVVKNLLSNAGMRVQSLVKELRFHMLWGN